MVKLSENKHQLKNTIVKSTQEAISLMHQEHNTEGERFRKISQLTKQYTPPADACGTYKVTLQLLHAFEKDLHLHIHLENNILFPKVTNLEFQLKTRNVNTEKHVTN